VPIVPSATRRTSVPRSWPGRSPPRVARGRR
jgi:hypothetical protein